MRVSLTSGASTYYLAGQSGVSERVHSSAGDLRISATINTQTRAGVRRADAGERDRGNLSTTVSFTTSRTFATAALAEAWALSYDRSFPRTGTLAITPQGGSAEYLREAVVLPPARIVAGCTVTLSYTVRGSGLYTTVS